MIVTPLPKTGNSSKFQVTLTKGRGSFIIALSYTLKTKIWELTDEQNELEVANQLAEALVGRHDPKLPFKAVYAFAEHNTEPTVEAAIKYLKIHHI